MNAMMKRRELKLRREILVCDRIGELEYINGVRFENREHTRAVLDILSYWDFQSKLRGDDSILWDLIRDSELTYHLNRALSFHEASNASVRVEDAWKPMLKSLGDIVNSDDDIIVLDGMIRKLNNGDWQKVKVSVEKWVWDDVRQLIIPVISYLEELRNRMAREDNLENLNIKPSITGMQTKRFTTN